MVQEKFKYNYSHILKMKLQYLIILFPYTISEYIVGILVSYPSLETNKIPFGNCIVSILLEIN